MQRLLAILLLIHVFILDAKTENTNLPMDSTKKETRISHRLSASGECGYVLPTDPFLEGDNARQKAINTYGAIHLAYTFRFKQNPLVERLYGNVYQGAGAAWYTFGNRRELGNPFMVYLLQGARIARLGEKLSLNYEWNLGLSWGWKPHSDGNSYNVGMGSRLNAYINAGMGILWRLSERTELWTGATLSHFSNGNTNTPNSGINILGFRANLACTLAPAKERHPTSCDIAPPRFPRHVSYDVIFFGSWRRKEYYYYGERHSPNTYAVLGTSVSAMYNAGYKLRMGGALDMVYDASANEYARRDPSQEDGFAYSPPHEKIALGASGRIEFVMPIFTIGIGLGGNILYHGEDLKTFYQMLYLKIAITRSTFLHVGYRLQEFKDPNFLMFGFGFRLNNKYPAFTSHH